MSIHSFTHHPRPRSRQAAAAVAAFALTALALPGLSNARTASVNGIRAELDHGTLQVTSTDQSNTVALRLASGDPTQLQVDVGNDGAADFSFPRAAVSAINVR